MRSGFGCRYNPRLLRTVNNVKCDTLAADSMRVKFSCEIIIQRNRKNGFKDQQTPRWPLDWINPDGETENISVNKNHMRAFITSSVCILKLYRLECGESV